MHLPKNVKTTSKDFNTMNLDHNSTVPLHLTDESGAVIAISSNPYYLPTEGEFGDNCPDVVYHIPASENPYNGFTTIDETPNPLSHGQFLGNLAGIVDPDTIWRLGEGDETALDEISNPATRERATNIFDRIDGMGYWDNQLGNEPTSNR